MKLLHFMKKKIDKFIIIQDFGQSITYQKTPVRSSPGADIAKASGFPKMRSLNAPTCIVLIGK